MKPTYNIAVFVMLSLISAGKTTLAQPNIWDIPATEALISHNKTNFSDNKKVKENQVASTVTVGILKRTKDKSKQLIDSLDRRLNSLYIILADATLGVQVASIMRDVYQLS